MRRETRHAASPVRDAVLRVQGAQHPQQRFRVLPVRRGRRRQPGESVDRRRSPRRRRQHGRREVGVHDLGLHRGQQQTVLRLGPEPQTESRADASRTTAPLLRPIARETQRLQAVHARTRREPTHAHKPRVDHRRHSLDGQRRLGDRGGEHDLALPVASRQRPQHGVLLLLRQRTIERHHHAPQAIDAVGPQLLLAAPNLALTRQKAEDVAAGFRQGALHRTGHLRGDRRGGFNLQIFRLNRIHPRLGSVDVGIAKVRGNGFDIQRRGHHQQPQIVPQRAAHVERHRKPKIALQGPLVELIEDDEPHIGELGVGDEPMRQKPFRHDLEPRPGGDLPLETNLKSDRFPQRLPQTARDVRRTAPRRQPPRLQHEDLLPLQERRVQQRRRHTCRLSAARRRPQHNRAVARERRTDLRDDCLDGERHVLFKAA